MYSLKKDGVILEKSTFEFENEGVCNPAVIRDGEDIHVLYRAVRKGNHSTIGYCKLNDPLSVVSRNTEPLLVPEAPYESHGIEDPRIVKIEDLFYLTYTAYDGRNALGALATSKDLQRWCRCGIVVPKITYKEFERVTSWKGSLNEKYLRYNEYQKSHKKLDKNEFIWSKNLVLFPKKINGKFCFLQRIKPDIQIVVLADELTNITLDFWRNFFLNFDKYIVLRPKYQHEVSYIGSGCPPIETPQGWLIIYHGVHDTIKGYVYSACAALLDLENPQKEIARLPYPLFFPEEEWELKGEVNNVCFPSGAIVTDGVLYIYYGAADTRIAVASVNLQDLIAELLKYKL
ncbi:MAG TPA: pesticidal protein Cry7Aa [Flavobacteriales bacterium]|jgi:predicted GH43/DUF377 family glycosyl hydrolase|nr:pesticidal protein Cry7Aa [Flavobacteriales bacterium]